MIAIISATEYEISTLKKKIAVSKVSSYSGSDFFEGSYLNIPIVYAFSGVGPKRARSCTEKLLKYFSPRKIVSAGFAGALNPKLRAGDIVVPGWVYSRKHSKKIGLQSTLPYLAFSYSKGGLLTESSFINNRKKKLDLYLDTGADIVDMETWGIIEAASVHDTSVLSVRVVSDSTSDHMPRMEKIYTGNTGLDLQKTCSYFIKNPEEIINFLKFNLVNLRKARISLNGFLEILITVVHEENRI